MTVNAASLSNAALGAIQHGETSDAPVTSGETFPGTVDKRAGVVWEVVKLATGSSPTAQADLTFSYSGIPGISDESTLKLLTRSDANDTNWADTDAIPDTANDRFTLTNQTSFIQYAIGAGSDNSLPVELSTFTATSSDGKVTLHWRTESEVNNIGFSIYRNEERDGNYTEIAFIYGAINSAMPNDYQFTDTKAEAGKTYFYYIEDIDIEGEKNKSEIIKVIVPPAKSIPKEFRLLQNFPNPFNPETWIPYELATDASVTIRIYNVNGELVRQFSLGKKKADCYIDKQKAVYWDSKDQNGETVSSGLYFYTLKAGDFKAIRRTVIVK